MTSSSETLSVLSKREHDKPIFDFRILMGVEVTTEMFEHAISLLQVPPPRSLIESMELLDCLLHCPFLANLSRKIGAQMCSAMKLLVVKPGGSICYILDQTEDVYLLSSGLCVVQQSRDDKEIILGSLKEGECVTTQGLRDRFKKSQLNSSAQLIALNEALVFAVSHTALNLLKIDQRKQIVSRQSFFLRDIHFDLKLTDVMLVTFTFPCTIYVLNLDSKSSLAPAPRSCLRETKFLSLKMLRSRSIRAFSSSSEV
jgi:hypothetical protein